VVLEDELPARNGVCDRGLLLGPRGIFKGVKGDYKVLSYLGPWMEVMGDIRRKRDPNGREALGLKRGGNA